MTQTFSLQRILCRPALERDLAEIREFCKTIWDGHDYVPEVIDDWFQDPQGLFAVAEYQGRAIACSKITWLAEGQWWLEGFRVDPKYQGLKVGSFIHRYLDRWWLEHGNGALRLMTSSRNQSVHHLCESTDFVRRFEVRGYTAEPLDGPVDMFTSASFSDPDLARAIEFTRRSPSLALTNRVVDFGWQFADPTQEEALASLISTFSRDQDHIFWWRKDRGLLITWNDDSNDEEQRMRIGVLACELADTASFLVDVRRLAAEQKKTTVFWLAPVHAQVEAALQEAGYSSDWENTAYLFEKRHPTVP